MPNSCEVPQVLSKWIIEIRPNRTDTQPISLPGPIGSMVHHQVKNRPPRTHVQDNSLHLISLILIHNVQVKKCPTQVDPTTQSTSATCANKIHLHKDTINVCPSLVGHFHVTTKTGSERFFPYLGNLQLSHVIPLIFLNADEVPITRHVSFLSIGPMPPRVTYFYQSVPCRHVSKRAFWVFATFLS